MDGNCRQSEIVKAFGVTSISVKRSVKKYRDGGPGAFFAGLLRHAKQYFSLPKGFYSLSQIFILLAFMALDRIRSIEQLRYAPAGEYGKLLGLDRIPEVRTLRKKIRHLAKGEEVGQWSGELSREWMEAEPEAAGILYVDGHVRLYHGKQTKLPRRYVSRERLCLRGTTDYWVNDHIGRPFFVVATPFTFGLLKVLRDDIVTRLIQDVPDQPTQEELNANGLAARFTMVFDREGYSPEFFQEMWDNHRIACQTYHKYPKADWSESEFCEASVDMPHGHQVKMKLAERGTRMSNGLWMREVRKRSETGHQISVLSTDYTSDAGAIGGHMFTRWSQENFLKYMMEHFGIDRLIEYQTEPADETKPVVNPAYRKLESQIKSKAAMLARRLASFGQTHLSEGLSEKEIAKYARKQGELKEEIGFLQHDLDQLKNQRKQTARHVALGQLPKEERFAQLAPVRKQFIDTIRMIAYRAETSMAILLRGALGRSDDARPLLREIFTTEADLIPNHEDKTLTVRLHHLTNAMSDKAARYLAQRLNESEIKYPGTELRLIYKLVSDAIPADQEF